MIIKKSFRILLHAGFWLAHICFILIILFAVSQGVDMKPEDTGYYVSFIFGIAIIPPVTSFYLHYHYLFANYLQRRKLLLSMVFSAVISLLAVFLGFTLILLTSKDASTCLRECFLSAMGFTFAVATVFGVIGLVLKGFLTWYEELKVKEELIEKTHRMEMALVKSQLDPHFLFNTINNIDILIEVVQK